MIASLALVAFAEPPRGEVIAGFSGNTDQGYGFATFQPALLRSEDASIVLRGTVSQLYYAFLDQGTLNEVGSPGLSIGPGFTYTPGDVGFGMAVGVGVRRSTRTIDVLTATTYDIDALLTGDVTWRPQQKASLYGQFSFSAANPYLWARVGAMASAVPLLRANTPVAVWLGFEVTTNGNFESRVLELGPVVEVPIRDIHTVFSARGGLSLQRAGGELEQAPTIGLGVYWWY